MLIKKISGFVIALLFAGSASATVISVVPESTQVYLGDLVTVNVMISDFDADTALGGYDLELYYDASILSVTKFSFDDPVLGDQLDLQGYGSWSERSIYSSPMGDLIEFFKLSLDHADVLLSQQADEFALASIEFRATNLGYSNLDIMVRGLIDQNGSDISADLMNSGINVIEVPSPAVAALLLAGFPLLWMRKRVSLNTNTPA